MLHENSPLENKSHTNTLVSSLFLVGVAAFLIQQYASLYKEKDSGKAGKTGSSTVELVPGFAVMGIHTDLKDLKGAWKSLLEPVSFHIRAQLLPIGQQKQPTQYYSVPMDFSPDFEKTGIVAPDTFTHDMEQLLESITHEEPHSIAEYTLHEAEESLEKLAKAPVLRRRMEIQVTGFSSPEAYNLLGFDNAQNKELSAKRASLVEKVLLKELERDNVMIRSTGEGEIPLDQKQVELLAELVDAPADKLDIQFQNRVSALVQAYNDGDTLPPATVKVLDAVFKAARKTVITVDVVGKVYDVSVGLPFLLLIFFGMVARGTKQSREQDHQWREQARQEKREERLGVRPSRHL